MLVDRKQIDRAKHTTIAILSLFPLIVNKFACFQRSAFRKTADYTKKRQAICEKCSTFFSLTLLVF